jgi:signal transduction histidine kinase
MLRQIDEKTLLAVKEKSVLIYTETGKLIYSYIDENTQPVTASVEIITAALHHKTYHFSVGKKDAIAIYIPNVKNNYIVVSSAWDETGFEKLYELKWILFLSFIVSVIITIVFGLLFSLQVTVPIQRITHEVNEISSLQLSRRIRETGTKDELNDLIHTFNNLMTRLQESFEIQTRFITNASHELSTPLTAILSQLEITLQNTREVAEYQFILRSVYEDVRGLAQLTRSLLEIAKASGTSNGIELKLIRMDELLMDIPPEIKKINKTYQVELNFDSFPENEDLMMVFGNDNLLISAIKNIITNACKYSDNNLALVNLSFLLNCVQIEITDNGHGINEADLPFIFQPFFRGTITSGQQGSGLGLSLTERIISLHKGHVQVLYTGSNGTCFRINLPIAKQFHAR